MIALILGGAPAVFREAAEAAALLNRRHMVVAANKALIHYAGRIDAVASLHPDLLDGWITQRDGNKDFRRFSPPSTPERWPGSSGLYALQCALFEMGATAAILCGVPMDSDAGHFTDPGQWAGTFDYRQACELALLEAGGRIRSQGGWTAELFGKPTAEWVGAVDNIRPLGVSAAEGSLTMHKVTNTSKGTQSFWARNPDGSERRVHLGPGDSETVEINADDPVFAGGDLAISKSSAPAPKAAEPAPPPNKPPANPQAKRPFGRR